VSPKEKQSEHPKIIVWKLNVTHQADLAEMLVDLKDFHYFLHWSNDSMSERNHESDSSPIPYRLYYYNIPIIISDSMLINVQVLDNIGKLYFTSIMKNRITNRINIMQISILIVPSIVIRCLYYYLLLFNVFNAESYMLYCHLYTCTYYT
jgi:hypothetical protein